jgi:hypothetical protein
MSLFPPNWIAVAKAGDDDGVEQFIVLYVDPQQADRAGHIWSTLEPMTDEELREFLTERGWTDATIQTAVASARAQFDSSQGEAE